MYYIADITATSFGIWLGAILLARLSPKLRAGIAAQTQIEGPLSGLRGILAIIVFVHHQEFARTWMNSGGWSCGNRFWVFLGHGAVFLFLMISGYVFWLKAEALEGRISWRKLMASRVRRLAPAYYFSLILVLIQAMPKLIAAPLSISSEFLLRALTIGALWWSRIPGLDTVTLNGHVHFILFYQWCFYGIVPILASCCVGRRFPLVFLTITTLAVLAQRCFGASIWWLSFLPGILIAHIQLSERMHRILSGWRGAVFALGWAGMVLGCGGIKWMQFELLAVVPLLLVVAAGNNLGGILEWEPVRVIARMSYSFYLLHAIVLMGLIRILQNCLMVRLLPVFEWAALVFAATIITCLLSFGCWRWIEESFRKSSAT